MRNLSVVDNGVLQRRFTRLLRVGLLLLSVVAALAATLAIESDRVETTEAARRADTDLSSLLRLQTDALLDPSYYSMLGVAKELSDAPDVSAFMARRATRALQTAMTYDSVSNYLFVRAGGSQVVVDASWRRTSELDPVVARMEVPTESRKPHLLAPMVLAGGGEFVPLVILETRTANGVPALIGALIPVNTIRNREFAPGSVQTANQALYLKDGELLMSSSGTPTGSRAPSPEAITVAAIATGADSGAISVALADGSARTGFFFKSTRYPFIAVSSRDSASYLGAWRIRTYFKLGVLAVFLAILFGGGRILLKNLAKVNASETVYRRLFEDVADIVLVCSRNGEIEALNASACIFLGAVTPSEVVGRSIFEFIPRTRELGSHGHSDNAFGRFERALSGERLSFDLVFESPVTKETVYCDTHLSAFEHNEREHLLVVIRDRSTERRYLKQQEYLANHDPLTGLLNRLSLIRTIDRRIEESPGAPMQLILLDLMRFHEVNDTFGHRAGDMVLETTARRVSMRMEQEGWILARAGGDELVAISGEGIHLDLRSACTLLAEVIGESILVGESHIELRAKMGTACYPEDALDASHLLRCADIAVAHAKTLIAATVPYHKEIDRAPGRDLKLRGDLSIALREGHLTLAFQPKIHLEDREVTGVEALLRWDHPKLGWIAPAEFVPLIESTELIYPLTAWVLGEAVEQIRVWQMQGRDLSIAVNISANNLQDPDFSEYVKDLLRRKGVSPRLLELEVTEAPWSRIPRWPCAASMTCVQRASCSPSTTLASVFRACPM